MRSPDGHEMWGKFNYREIAKPDRIVFTNSFSDRGRQHHTRAVRGGLAAGSAEHGDLHEENGKTIVTLRGAPYNASPSERHGSKP